MDQLILIQAAMFAAIGTKTKFSRNGYSVVFVEPVCGRHDLSELREGFALAQAQAAGLDLESVTPEQVAAYQDWYERMYQARRISEARILVTRPHGAERGRELVPANSVRLVDGWSEIVDWREVEREEYYDPHAINRIGGTGAYCRRTDYAGIERAIAELIRQHPEFANARIQDNNQRGAK